MITRDIATVTDPKRVAFQGSPVFLEVAAKPHAEQYLELRVEVGAGSSASLVLTRSGGDTHTFTGSTDLEEVGGSVFYINTADQAETAQNLREAIAQDDTLSALFEVATPFAGGDNGEAVLIRARRAISAANFTAVASGALSLDWIEEESTSGDELLDGENRVKIGAELFRGGPFSVALLEKVYAGDPIWFKYGALGVPSQPSRPSAGLFDPGTWAEYRVALKKIGKTSPYFYESRPFYILAGENRRRRDAEAFLFSPYEGAVPQLSNAPVQSITEGQALYVNLLKTDLLPQGPWSVRLSYWKAGAFVGEVLKHPAADLMFFNVWRVDPWEDLPEGCDEVRTEIVNSEGAAASLAKSYKILPVCIFTGIWFSFINDLGGWDSITFADKAKREDKAAWTTAGQAITPHNLEEDRTQIRADLTRTHTLESLPVSDDEAEWAAEFAASPLILDQEGRRVLLDEFAIPSDGAKNYKRINIKYRYADSRALY